MPTKRIEYIDALRGFTMILVVFSHVLLFTFDYNSSFINGLFILFRMPLFFFISGFIGYKANLVWNRQTWCTMSKKKLLVQLLPTFVFGLIYTYAYRHLDYEAFFEGHGKLGYWFTIVLLEMFLLLYTTNVICYCEDQQKFKKRVFTSLIVLSVIMFGLTILLKSEPSLRSGFHLFSFDLCCKHFPFFVFGYICSMHRETFSKILASEKFPTIIIVAFAILFCVDYYYFKPHLGNSLLCFTLKEFVNRILGFLGLLIVYNTFRVYQSSFTTEKKVGRALQYIGKRTLDIYLLHYFFLPSLPQLGVELFSEGKNATLELVMGLLLSLIIIGLCVVVSNILRTSPLLAQYLFGVKSKK